MLIFFNLKVLIFCVNINKLSINFVLLLLSIRHQGFIFAVQALKTKCLFLIFGTLLHIAHAEILTRLIVGLFAYVKVLSS